MPGDFMSISRKVMPDCCLASVSYTHLLDGVEANSAATEHHRYRTRLDLGRVDHGSDSGHDAAADERGAIQRHILIDLHQIIGVQRRELGHHAAAAKHIEGSARAVARAHRPIRQGVQRLERLLSLIHISSGASPGPSNDSTLVGLSLCR